jgi:hypothetical protein
MTIQNVVQNVSSGGNTIGHVVTAATLGDGLSSVLVWGLQSAHLDPPAAVSQGITAISMVIASYLMQKLAD